VLSFLNKNNLAIAATHDSELTTMLHESFDMVHFCESFGQDGVSFDYVLKKGKLPHGNAIRILELNGYPDEIIQRAYRLSDNSRSY
jgi:DNA mismatch repair ATPase MutS